MLFKAFSIISGLIILGLNLIIVGNPLTWNSPAGATEIPEGSSLLIIDAAGRHASRGFIFLFARISECIHNLLSDFLKS